MSKKITEGEDFYMEKGLQVFYASYLLKRGYCCKSACRHCPYGYQKPSSTLDKLRQELKQSDK